MVRDRRGVRRQSIQLIRAVNGVRHSAGSALTRRFRRLSAKKFERNANAGLPKAGAISHVS